MILNVCNSPDILSAMSIVKTIITILKIAGAVALILSGMIGFVKGELKGDVSVPLRSLVKKSIAALIIFLLPTMVNVIVKVADANIEYYSCIDNANDEYIELLYEKQANSLVVNAKTTLKSGAYTSAKVAVDKLKDGSEKTRLKAELEKVNQEMIAIQKQREEEKKRQEDENYQKYKESQENINKQKENLNTQMSESALSAGYQPLSGIKGKYTKDEIINMSEEKVKAMSKSEFFDFIGSAAQIVYSEYGGVLPSITIAQASLESGYGKKFSQGTYNVYGLIGYPGEKPQVGRLRKFDNFYEATYYHTQYFFAYSQNYGNLLTYCKNKDPFNASLDLRKYAGGDTSYPGKIQSIMSTNSLTKYD